jgi:thiamine biosynthesis lipoprotein
MRQKVFRYTVCLFLYGVLLISFPAYGDENPGYVVSEHRALMGTEVIIKVFGDNRPEMERAVQDAFEEISRLERMMSNFIPTSELSRINQQAGKTPVPVSRELFSVIQKSLMFSDITEGTFDISFASVGKLWDFRAGILPPPEAIAKQLPYVDYRKIRLNEKDSSVFLPYPEMEIGLGGIGKGYAVDRAMEVLTKQGIHDAIIMAGGDMMVKGKKGKDLWRVGLRDPDNKDRILAVLPLQDQAVSTSGDYERFFIKDGVRYHHIIDTRTGYPARLCRSVTLLSKDATTTDGLTKGVFIMGPERGMALVERLEGVEAIIIDAQGKIHLSSGLTSLKMEEAKGGK